jgi:hypothetical protein
MIEIISNYPSQDWKEEIEREIHIVMAMLLLLPVRRSVVV